MNLVPTYKQFKNWSLPSKFSIIGAVIGVISLLVSLTVISVDVFSNIEERNSILFDYKWKLVNPNEFMTSLFNEAKKKKVMKNCLML